MKHASEFQNYGDYAENCTTSRTMVSNILSSKKHKFKEVFEVSLKKLKKNSKKKKIKFFL